MKELTCSEIEVVAGGIQDWVIALGGAASCFIAAACFVPTAAASVVITGIGAAIAGVIGVGYGVYKVVEGGVGILVDNSDAIFQYLASNNLLFIVC
jgi:hypothetical protein